MSALPLFDFDADEDLHRPVSPSLAGRNTSDIRGNGQSQMSNTPIASMAGLNAYRSLGFEVRRPAARNPPRPESPFGNTNWYLPRPESPSGNTNRYLPRPGSPIASMAGINGDRPYAQTPAYGYGLNNTFNNDMHRMPTSTPAARDDRSMREMISHNNNGDTVFPRFNLSLPRDDSSFTSSKSSSSITSASRKKGNNKARSLSKKGKVVASGNKRKRDDVSDDKVADDDDSDMDFDAAPKKRLVRNVKIDLTSKGRVIGRMLHLTRNFREVIDLGRSVDLDAADNSTYEIKAKEHLVELEKYIPDLMKRIREGGPDIIESISRNINIGRANARADDAFLVKRHIGNLFPFVPPLPLNKAGRGLNHQHCRKLIAPTTVDPSDPVVDRKLQDGLILISTGDYGLYMYVDETFYPDRIFCGFLCGELPKKVGVLLLFGPAAAEDEDPTAHRNRGIAKKFNIKEITVPFIAYATTLTRFGISSDEDFTINAGGRFSYATLYKSIIKVLNMMKEEDRAAIVSDWQEYVFPENTDDDEEDVEDQSAFPPGCAANEMFKQLQ